MFFIKQKSIYVAVTRPGMKKKKIIRSAMAENGTGKAVAEPVFHIVLPWKILNHVVPLSYNTYSINTKKHSDRV